MADARPTSSPRAGRRRRGRSGRVRESRGSPPSSTAALTRRRSSWIVRHAHAREREAHEFQGPARRTGESHLGSKATGDPTLGKAPCGGAAVSGAGGRGVVRHARHHSPEAPRLTRSRPARGGREPTTLGSPRPGFDERLFKFLAHRIGEAIIAAAGPARPALVTYAERPVTGLAPNRSFSATSLEHVAHEQAARLVVLDDQDQLGGVHRSGMVKVKVEPPPALLSTQMRPP